jgi:hypothetical protein
MEWLQTAKDRLEKAGLFCRIVCEFYLQGGRKTETSNDISCIQEPFQIIKEGDYFIVNIMAWGERKRDAEYRFSSLNETVDVVIATYQKENNK